MGLQKRYKRYKINQRFHPILLEGWNKRHRKKCPSFPWLLALSESCSQSSSNATDRRLGRPLVKMQTSFYPEVFCVKWLKARHEEVNLKKKKKKTFQYKAGRKRWFFFLSVSNGVKFSYRILNSTLHFQELSLELWGSFSERSRTDGPTPTQEKDQKSPVRRFVWPRV